MNETRRMKSAVRVLRELTEAHGASGGEGPVREIFRRELGRMEVSTDRLGNVVAEMPERPTSPRVLIAGHMDEVGFLVQQITKEGFIRFTTVGGWWSHTLLAQRVRIRTRNGEEVLGVITSTPPHFLSGDQKNKVLPIDKLFIDVGAESREQVESEFGIRVGDSVVPATDFVQTAHPHRYMSKAFDNRVGMALTVQAMKALADEATPNRPVGVGTVQEEVGLRGARIVGASAKPDVALVLEGPPADDTPGFNRAESQGKLGGGVQIRVMDTSAIMNRALVDFVRDVAEQERIPHQVTVRRSGGTDAGSLQFGESGVPVVVLGVPARYIHTHNAIIDMRDYLAALDLVLELVRRMDEATVRSFTEF